MPAREVLEYTDTRHNTICTGSIHQQHDLAEQASFFQSLDLHVHQCTKKALERKDKIQCTNDTRGIGRKRASSLRVSASSR